MHTPSQLGQSRAGHAGQWLHGTSWADRDGLFQGPLGFLGVPWTASVEQTPGLQLLVHPVDQHGRTAGLYQKTTAPRMTFMPTWLSRSTMLEDYSSQCAENCGPSSCIILGAILPPPPRSPCGIRGQQGPAAELLPHHRTREAPQL